MLSVAYPTEVTDGSSSATKLWKRVQEEESFPEQCDTFKGLQTRLFLSRAILETRVRINDQSMFASLVKAVAPAFRLCLYYKHYGK